MVAVSALPPVRPPALAEATKRSTTLWQENLQELFKHAKDRFPDVVWDLIDENADDGETEEVWGHKAIVYARAPPSFQQRYFQSRPLPAVSPGPYSSSPTPSIPAASALSLNLGPDYASSFRSVSPFRPHSPAPSTAPGTLLRLPLVHNPVLFQNELEYLYTGKGFGEAFEFLFDAGEKQEEGDGEEKRIDKLRKDLVFMWRSRLYSDVRIELTGHVSGTEEETTAVFSTHRFILTSRSPYFWDALVTYSNRAPSYDTVILRLPSPPFTPPSLHFILGYLYTGTLSFSNRTYDLDTGFHIMRSAAYLQLTTLYDEIQARVVQEMMHGLFHAFLEFAEYERITGGKWGTGGCKCRQCARRAPRVLEFAVAPDVQNIYLDRGARRALVGIFGEGWCTPEFSSLPQKTKDGLLKGLAKRTTPMNVFPLLFAAHHALNRLNSILDSWADGTREMVLAARKTIDDTLCDQAEACFEQPEWLEMMESDGSRFEDGERVEWIMEAIQRGLADKNAGSVYQTLVSSVLLRQNPEEPGTSLLSSISHIRVQVEQTRVEVLKFLKRRWAGVRQEGGFDNLEGWALKEISDDIDIPVEDLRSPPAGPLRQTRTVLRATSNRMDDNDGISIHSSLRTSVLSGNAGRQNNARQQQVVSSGASVRSVARSTLSTATRSTAVSVQPARLRVTNRPESKMASSVTSSARSSMMDVDDDGPEEVHENFASTSRRPPSIVPAQDAARPKSIAASVSSVRSHASTIRRNAAGPGPSPGPGQSTLRPPAPAMASRPNSTASSRSESARSETSTNYKTARESVTRDSVVSRTRRVSTASTISTRSGVSPKVNVPPLPSTRVRKSSDASTTSVASSVATPRAKRLTPKVEKSVLSPSVKRTVSSTSMRSTASTSTTASKKALIKRPTSEKEKEKIRISRPLPSLPSKENIQPEGQAIEVSTGKGKERAEEVKKLSVAKSDSSSSHATLRKRESNETITKLNIPQIQTTEHSVEIISQSAMSPSSPKGATLDIGIPCIVSSKRKRFRALARYIGEVEGEEGPWVGVEVPVSVDWEDDLLANRPWNDGTWGGVRYFELGSAIPEWGDDDRLVRRRRPDGLGLAGSSSFSTLSLKREGDQLSVDRKKRLRSASPTVSDVSGAEYRGLFVRPQQVLYVVDAVGS